MDTQFELAILLDFVKSDQLINLKKYLNSVFGMISKMIENTK
ncbi:hypothetical protein [Niastella koreensis]